MHIAATDSVYTTDKSYEDTVKFIDEQAHKGPGLEQLRRTVIPTATGWTLKLASGQREHIIVRNTQPTSIETLVAVGRAVIPPEENR
jgi:hypothetical protein